MVGREGNSSGCWVGRDPGCYGELCWERDIFVGGGMGFLVGWGERTPRLKSPM